MKKYTPIYIYGAIIILEGIFLLFSKHSTFEMIRLTTGILLTLGAVIAFVAAFSRQRQQVQFAYHEMHALAMLVYGVSVLIFCNSFEKIISVTAFLFIFYALSEIIFCNWILNLDQKSVYKIIVFRSLIGLAVGVGTFVSMNVPASTLQGFGILFIIVGVSILLYVPVIKEK